MTLAGVSNLDVCCRTVRFGQRDMPIYAQDMPVKQQMRRFRFSIARRRHSLTTAPQTRSIRLPRFVNAARSLPLKRDLLLYIGKRPVDASDTIARDYLIIILFAFKARSFQRHARQPRRQGNTMLTQVEEALVAECCYGFAAYIRAPLFIRRLRCAMMLIRRRFRRVALHIFYCATTGHAPSSMPTISTLMPQGAL